MVEPLHRGRGYRSRSAGTALRTDHNAVQAQPQYRFRPCRHFRRTGGRRLLRHRPAWRPDRNPNPPSGDQASAPGAVLPTGRDSTEGSGRRVAFSPGGERAPSNPPLNRPLYRDFGAFSALGWPMAWREGRKGSGEAHGFDFRMRPGDRIGGPVKRRGGASRRREASPPREAKRKKRGGSGGGKKRSRLGRL